MISLLQFQSNECMNQFSGLSPKHWQLEARKDGILILSLERKDSSVNTLCQAVLNELDGLLERMATWSPRAVSLSVLLLLVVASGTWLVEGEGQRHDLLRVQARQVAESQAYALQRTLERNLTALEVMAARVEQGLANGLLAQDLREALTHLAFYAGWPKASTALALAEAVFKKRA